MGDRTSVARQWWKLIENDRHVFRDPKDATIEKPASPGYCGLRRWATEESVFLVFSRLEALASCAASGLCDLDVVITNEEQKCTATAANLKYDRTKFMSKQMIESFDYFTVMAIAHYFWLSKDVSREYNIPDGNVGVLLSRIEKYSKCWMLTQRDKIWNGREGGVRAEDYYSQTKVQMPAEKK